MDDPEGRRTLADLIPDRKGRLFHVGRLDTDTEGLILLTNDGDLAHRLAHPSYEVPKTYLADVAGAVGRDVLLGTGRAPHPRSFETFVHRGIQYARYRRKPLQPIRRSRHRRELAEEIAAFEGRQDVVRLQYEGAGVERRW